MLIPKLAKKIYPLGRLHEKFGDPRRRDVAVMRGVSGGFLILPTPNVERITGSQLQQFRLASIIVNPTDWVISDIPRFNYPEDVLINSRYVIDAVEVSSERFSGKNCEFIYLDDSDPLYFKVVVSGHTKR